MASRPKATIVDIARKAGVSKSTVSLVLKGSDLIRPETAEKVNRAIAELGYVYNRGAANLRKSRSNVVGMVINDLTNPFFAELAVGMERIFQAAGIVPFIANTAESPVRQAEVVKSFLEQGVAGLIVSPARGTAPDAFGEVKAAGVPLVFAMRRLPDSGFPSVAPDNRRGALAACEHLIRRGHRRIAFLGGYGDMVVYQERVGGYRDALAAHSIAPDDALIVEGQTNRSGGLESLTAVMRGAERPTAALCFNDAVAFGAMLALRKLGLEPGRDFAVVGFDDVIEAQHYVPPLTSVAVDPGGLGERAAHAVLRMMQSGTTHIEDHVGAVHLVVRDSSGPDPNERRENVA